MKAYSFLNTVVVLSCPALGPHEVTDWADGDDTIEITRLNDSASHKVGADGKMVVALSADKSGSFKFKVWQTSPTNKYLNDALRLQEAGAETFQPISALFQDTYRQDTGTGTFGYIKKLADIPRGMGVNAQEWEIVVERLDMLLGNPDFVGFATVAAEAQ
jgi:hypothetical protein